jgi:Ala-tRNA(Pro) deacylase
MLELAVDRPLGLRAMAATEDDLLRFLDRLGVHTETARHPPVFTVEESKALRGALPGAHSKNLFLKDKKGTLWLVVVDEDRVVDLKELRRRLGAATLSFARPEVLREALGIEPGSVTPFAVLNDPAGRVRVVVDAGLLGADRLNFHPLTNTATTAISPQGLLAFLVACGHQPEVLSF